MLRRDTSAKEEPMLRTLVVFSVCLSLMASDGVASANRTSCMMRKLSAARFKQEAKFRCHTRAATAGVPADAACLAKAEARFSASFVRADASAVAPCFVTGDAAAIEAKLDAFVDDAVTDVRPSLTPSSCAAKKLQAVGKKTAAKLSCHRTAVATAVLGDGVVDSSCLTRAEERFASVFTHAEVRPGCQTTGDAATLEAKIDAAVDDVVTEIRPVPASGCAGPKVKGAGEKADEKLQCHGQAAATGVTVDAACLGKAEARFSTTYAKAEVRTDCVTVSDASTIETKVDAFVDDLVTELRPVTTASLCAESKFEATAHKTSKQLVCLGNIARDGLPSEPDCGALANALFSKTFSKFESGGGDCLTTGDMATIEAKVDAFVNDISTELVPNLP
jgi:hypothetical protein